MAARITVVGAGVVGLSTAVELQHRGHDVTVVAARPPDATLSSVAGAVWFPFQVGPDDAARVARLADVTRLALLDLVERAPEAGVDLLRFFEIEPDGGDAQPWWARSLSVTLAPAPVRGAPLAWTFLAPRAQPSLFLPYLVRQLARPIAQQRVESLESLDGDFVVNCSGMGARALARDAALRGVHGHVVICAPGQVALDVTITDSRDPASFFYVIPRRDELVLGGLALPVEGDSDLPPDAAHTTRILAHAERLGLCPGAVCAVRTGLRPVRATLRIERDTDEPRLFHNYGHGGSGFTLAHGSAIEIADAIDAA